MRLIETQVKQDIGEVSSVFFSNVSFRNTAPDDTDDDAYLRILTNKSDDGYISLSDLEADTHFNRKELTIMLKTFRKVWSFGSSERPHSM